MAPLLMFAVLAIPIVIAITFHEAAHGYVAHALGDDTAEREGRLTLNPLSHIDPWGTLLLPAILLLTLGIAFGYAKPIPVDTDKLRNPKRDMALVAAAGPLTNIALAIAIALLLAATRGVTEDYPLWRATLHASIVLNFILAFLNTIPLPPLDASKVVAAMLPRAISGAYWWAEPYGYLIVVLVFLVVPYASPRLGYSIDTAGYFLIRPAYGLTEGLLKIIGAA
ncbi:MAG: site-2 protease family protein [Micropepsaceae bacterium]